MRYKWSGSHLPCCSTHSMHHSRCCHCNAQAKYDWNKRNTLTV